MKSQKMIFLYDAEGDSEKPFRKSQPDVSIKMKQGVVPWPVIRAKMILFKDEEDSLIAGKNSGNNLQTTITRPAFICGL